jgi:MFS family permease
LARDGGTGIIPPRERRTLRHHYACPHLETKALTGAGEASTGAAPVAPADDRALRIRRVRLYAASFLMDTVGYAYPVLVSKFAEFELGAGSVGGGLLGTAITSAYAAGCFLMGGLSDRIGSMPLLWAALVFQAGCALPSLLFAGSLPVLCLSGAAFGLSMSLFWPPRLRELALSSPGSLLWRCLGAFNVAWAAGGITGCFTAGKAYEEFGFRWAVGMAIRILLVILALAAFRSRRARGAPPEAPLEDVEQGKARRFLHVGWVANFFAAFASGGLAYTMVHVGKGLSFSVTMVGVILASREIGRLVAFVCLRWWGGWHYSLWCLAVIQLAAAGALIASGFVESAWAFFALFLVFGLYLGLAYYSSVYYSLNLRSAQGRKSELHEGVLAVGLALGPFYCGMVGARFPSWPAVVPFAAGLVLAAGLAVEVALARRR